MAITLRDIARDSIGSVIPAKSMELKHTIHLIEVMTEEIDEIEDSIKSIMDTCNSPIMTIPGISYRMGAMILAEIGDFTRFNYANQILAFAGLSPSTYQSGQLDSSYSHMEKRGSRYLRYALFNAADYSGTLGATCPGFRSHRSGKREPRIPVFVSHFRTLFIRKFPLYCMYTPRCEYR